LTSIETPTYKNKKNYKETVVSTWRLLQYFKLPEKKFLQYFLGIFIIFAVFQNNYVFIPLFFAEPLTMFCGTLFEKHCSNVSNLANCSSPSPHIEWLTAT
jgi:hypothetical protein